MVGKDSLHAQESDSYGQTLKEQEYQCWARDSKRERRGHLHQEANKV